MSTSKLREVTAACTRNDNDPSRLMDILIDVQNRQGCIADEAMDAVARAVGVSRAIVEGAASFYAFFSKERKGKTVIRVCNDIVDRMNGVDVVARAFSEELGIGFGETTRDGNITLEYAPCIGMSDQGPAALVNSEVVTYLSSDKVREVVRTIKSTGDPKRLVHRLGDGNNAHPLVKSMVHNNIRRKGDVIFCFADYPANAGLTKALAMSPVEVINELKVARLRGRGGAGFPTGMKWEFTRGAPGAPKYILCNADEGEPGTFKDRVLLTEMPDRIFEGMTIAGYAVGAEHGILYLRGEYAYLYPFLLDALQKRRAQGLLGKGILGKKGLSFDIRLQLGAGAYICGEETALISSCEGLRGDPKNRPPFPAAKGYLGQPTAVNNVETYCAVGRLLQKGAGWFAETGSKDSTGTKLLSISGDCQGPGVYEVPFGVSVREMLGMVGADDAAAVQIGGPSGQLVAPAGYDRRITYDDLATGGSVMVFGQERDVLTIVHTFMEFFCDESCGYCTPCRAGNVLLKGYVEKVMAGTATAADVAIMKEVAETVKVTSRCGLGQTSPNPVLTSLERFRGEYDRRLRVAADGLVPAFDLNAELGQAAAIAERAPARH
jgi:[NiFe] hydrogenase diaphorase moiety large subunit